MVMVITMTNNNKKKCCEVCGCEFETAGCNQSLAESELCQDCADMDDEFSG